jgi:two-component system NtrC family sensor kinase
MKNVLDLSFRYKLPLWGSILIITTTLVVTGSLMLRTYEDLRADLLASSTNLSHRLAEVLFQPLMEDDVWRAFEIINAPLVDSDVKEVLLPKTIVVLDNALRVFVSTRPSVIPIQAGIEQLTPEYATLTKRISVSQNTDAKSFDMQDDNNILIAAPIVNEGHHFGTLVVIHSKSVLASRFFGIAQRAGWVGLLVLALLLPINWYWGQRLSRPLIIIAGWMNKMERHPVRDMNQKEYPYDDELGQLYAAYWRMLLEQDAREALEEQVIHSERLAAVGRLAAGVAHEINNPLGGMLTAIDTLKSHGDVDPRTAKTISLIERGLTQIKETVGALLVEARIKSRNVEPQDFEDIRSLVIPQTQKKAIIFDWRSSIAKPLPLQANPVRQLLLNLLLNAIQAAQHKGVVNCSIEATDDELKLSVENDGKQITAEQTAYLYEPFSPLTENGQGQGLGLWITYQIVQQLGGRINLDRNDGRMRFVVVLPLSERASA